MINHHSDPGMQVSLDIRVGPGHPWFQSLTNLMDQYEYEDTNEEALLEDEDYVSTGPYYVALLVYGKAQVFALREIDRMGDGSICASGCASGVLFDPKDSKRQTIPNEERR